MKRRLVCSQTTILTTLPNAGYDSENPRSVMKTQYHTTQRNAMQDAYTQPEEKNAHSQRDGGI
jgi:hypothetical protein